MEVGYHWGMMTNKHIKIGSDSYEKVKTFKYLDALLTNQNSIHEDTKNMKFVLFLSRNTIVF